MGYNTQFAGAVKVLPLPSTDFALKFNLFLSLRHCVLLENPSVRKHMERIWLPDGPYIPSLDAALTDAETRHKADLTKAPHLIYASKEFEDMLLKLDYKQRSTKKNKFPLYSLEQDYAPALYCDLRIVSSPEEECAYLMWNQMEKAYQVDGWVKYIAQLLFSQNYMLEGCLSAQGDRAGDLWSIIVTGKEVERVETYLEPTWSKESTAALKRAEDTVRASLRTV